MRHFIVIALMLAVLAGCDQLPTWMGGAEKQIVRLPGTREDVLQSDAMLGVDEIVRQVAFHVPAPVENTAWAQATGQFSAATGNLAASGGFTLHTNAEAGEGHEFSSGLAPRPVVEAGRVYVMDGEGYVSAHDAADISKKIWISASLTRDSGAASGGGLAAHGDRLYAVSGHGRVAALKAEDGTAIWTKDLGTPLRSAPRLAGNTLYVITIDSQLMALDAATGALRWLHRGIGETAGLLGDVAPTTVADMVIAPYGSGEMYALKADSGDEVWRASLAQTRRTEATAVFSGIGGDPVVDESVVFAVSSSGLLAAFNVLNGQGLWEKKIASINTPWLVGEYLFVLTEENVLVAMVKYDGRVRWSLPLARFIDEKRSLRPIVWRGPVMVGGKLVVVSSHGEMVRVDAATGKIETTIDVPGDIATPPIVAGGRLFLMDQDATLHSYQ